MRLTPFSYEAAIQLDSNPGVSRAGPRQGALGGDLDDGAAAGPLSACERRRSTAGGQGFDNQTVRMIVRTSIGGARVRIRLSNAFDSTPVVVGAAHIAIRSKDSEIVAGSDRPLAFDGKPGLYRRAGNGDSERPGGLAYPQARAISR